MEAATKEYPLDTNGVMDYLIARIRQEVNLANLAKKKRKRRRHEERAAGLGEALQMLDAAIRQEAITDDTTVELRNPGVIMAASGLPKSLKEL
jgi:hypothetical protein